jgi:hypothetical protein
MAGLLRKEKDNVTIRLNQSKKHCRGGCLKSTQMTQIRQIFADK